MARQATLPLAGLAQLAWSLITTFDEVKAAAAKPGAAINPAAAEALVLALVTDIPVIAIAIEVNKPNARVLVFMQAKLFAKVAV